MNLHPRTEHLTPNVDDPTDCCVICGIPESMVCDCELQDTTDFDSAALAGLSWALPRVYGTTWDANR